MDAAVQFKRRGPMKSIKKWKEAAHDFVITDESNKRVIDMWYVCQ